MSSDINVSRDQHTVPLKPSSYAWCVWVCGALFYCYQFILRVSPSVMTDELMHDFSVQACALGVLTAFYYHSYASMQVPVGMLIDRYGPRRLCTIALLLCVSGTFIFALSHNVVFAGIGRFLMGMGSAFAYVGTLKISTIWFPPSYVGRIIGLTMVFGTLGGVMGGTPLGYLIELLDWRYAMLLLAVIGLGLALSTWIIVRDRPNHNLSNQIPAALSPSQPKLWDGLITVATTPQIWLIGVFAGLMYVPLAAYADLWGIPFISELYKIDHKTAASLISMILFGIAIFSPITTYFSDRFASRKKFMTWSAVGATMIYCVAIYVPNIPMPVMYGLLFMGGIFFTGQILSFAAVTEAMPLTVSGVALGITNMTVMVSGVIFEPLIGWLLDWHWTQTGSLFQNGLPFYSLENYRFALMPVPISLFAAIMLTFVIKETYSKA